MWNEFISSEVMMRQYKQGERVYVDQWLLGSIKGWATVAAQQGTRVDVVMDDDKSKRIILHVTDVAAEDEFEPDKLPPMTILGQAKPKPLKD